MFELKDIEEIQRRARAEGWPFPYLFNSLKALGIGRYEVNVAARETRFVGQGSSVLQAAPEGGPPLTVAEAWNLEQLQAALARSRAKETDYGQFLSEIAAAGVGFYRVDMGPRTVTYHGPKPHKLVEKVPETAITEP